MNAEDKPLFLLVDEYGNIRSTTHSLLSAERQMRRHPEWHAMTKDQWYPIHLEEIQRDRDNPGHIWGNRGGGVPHITPEQWRAMPKMGTRCGRKP